ncbi:uncharacterized protein [Eurosta solidaginis]|uniref:uncharacterized protein n=1 Tax=Eurosta solidaginis TaxID=178769 RepID=UPI003530E180
MNLEDPDLFPTHFSHSKSYFTPPMPPNFPSTREFNWNYDGCDEICGDHDFGNCKEFEGYTDFENYRDFDGYDCFSFKQPRRRRPILPRSNFGRPTVRPETATTYNCSFYPKTYSKRRAIQPRNHIQSSCARPPHCTMNQLAFTYRLRHRLWY